MPSMLSSGGANKSKKNPARLSRVSANEAGEICGAGRIQMRLSGNKPCFHESSLYVST